MTQEPVTPNIASDDLLWAALCYPIFIIIPLAALLIEDKKNIPFIKYHATQAIIIQVILLVLMGISSVTVIGLCCLPILWLATLWPAYEAYQGKNVEIPVITDFAKNQGWL